MHISKLGRWCALLALAAGLVATGANPVMASPDSYSMTSVRVHTGLGAVDGYMVLQYLWPGTSVAIISGYINGVQTGDVVALLAKPFGTKSFAPTGKWDRLSRNGGKPARFTFTVQPPLETTYEVQVTTASQVDITSSPLAIYVLPGGSDTNSRIRCAHGKCTWSWVSDQLVPASAYSTEIAKRYFFYFGAARHRPTYLYRYGDASASRRHNISPHEYQVTLTLHFPEPPSQDIEFAEACTKNSERKDGIGLPRPTGCGARRIITFSYAG